MRRFVRPSIVSCSDATGVHLGLAVSFGFCDADRSTQCLVVPIALAADRSRRPCHRSTGADFSAADRGRGAAPRLAPVSARSTRLRPGTPSPSSFPEEDPGRLPPPSTSYPFRVWFCPRNAPFFRRGKTAVSEGFTPVQLALFIQLA